MAKNTEFLGTFNSFMFSIVRKVDPSFQEPDNFSISIYFSDPEEGEKEEIVRLDNSHGYVHMHRFFESQDSVEDKPSLDAFSGYDYLKANWQRFARLYFGAN